MNFDDVPRADTDDVEFEDDGSIDGDSTNFSASAGLVIPNAGESTVAITVTVGQHTAVDIKAFKTDTLSKALQTACIRNGMEGANLQEYTINAGTNIITGTHLNKTLNDLISEGVIANGIHIVMSQMVRGGL